jgi:hypothetical protein
MRGADLHELADYLRPDGIDVPVFAGVGHAHEVGRVRRVVDRYLGP